MQGSDIRNTLVQNQRLNKILQFDWLKIPNTIWLVVMFVCSRIPMLFLGFGLDPDAWRIANSAFDTRHHFAYHASRFPGYPVPEFMNALVIDFGWLATNSATMMLSLLSVLAFGRILKESECAGKGLLTITYAFMPLVWINSSNSMDYMWSLSFIIFTWLFLINSRYFLAGLMLALATGSRVTTAVHVIPFLFLMHSRNAGGKQILRFILTFFFASTFIFLPLYLTYGLDFIHRYPPGTGIMQIGYQVIKYCGLPSLTLLAALFITSVKKLRKVVAAREKNDIFILLSAIATIITFSAAPYHLEYLIPLIPFGLLVIWRIGRKPLVTLFCCAMLLHAFVTFGSIQHTDEGRLEVGIIDHGAVGNNIVARRAQMAYARRLANADIPERSVVITGTWLPILAYLDEDASSSMETKRMFDSNRPREGVWDFQRNIWYRYLVDLQELRKLQNDNYGVFYVKGIREFTLDTYGYDLNDYGAIYLAI